MATRQQKDYERLTPKQLQDQVLKPINETLGQLVSLAYSVGMAKGQGKEVTNGKGVKVNKVTINQQLAALRKEINSVKGYHSAAYKKRRARTEGKRTGTGFSAPIMVRPDLQTFFQKANLGNKFTVERDLNNKVSETTDTGVKLQRSIPYLVDDATLIKLGVQYGITTPAILTPLFSIYAMINELSSYATVNQGKKQDDLTYTFGKLGYDPLMADYFSATAFALAANAVAGKPIFDANNFRYADFQSIVKVNRYRNEDLSDKELGVLASPVTKGEMAIEQRAVSDTLAGQKYLYNKDDAVILRKKNKRKAQAAAKKAGGKATRAARA